MECHSITLHQDVITTILSGKFPRMISSAHAFSRGGMAAITEGGSSSSVALQPTTLN